MKILYLSNGQSIHARRRVEYLVRQGHKLFFYSLHPSGIKGAIDISPTSPFPYLPKAFVALYYVKLLLTTLAIRPDIIQVSYLTPVSALATLIGFKKVVITAWGGDLLKEQGAMPSWWSELLVKGALKRAAYLTMVSKELGTIASTITKGKVPVRVLRYGINTALFKKRTNTAEIKKLLSVSENDVLIISPRWPLEIYNLQCIVDSIPKILGHFPNAKFVFKKEGPYKSPVVDLYLGRLKQRIAELKIQDAIRWIPTVSEDDMVKIFNVAHVIVSVPFSDGSPLSVLEAMSCGKPVICSNLPSLREIINHNVNGMLVDATSADLLSDAIIQLLSNKPEAEKMGINGIEFVKNNADFETEMRIMDSIYVEMQKH